MFTQRAIWLGAEASLSTTPTNTHTLPQKRWLVESEADDGHQAPDSPRQVEEMFQEGGDEPGHFIGTPQTGPTQVCYTW